MRTVSQNRTMLKMTKTADSNLEVKTLTKLPVHGCRTTLTTCTKVDLNKRMKNHEVNVFLFFFLFFAGGGQQNILSCNQIKITQLHQMNIFCITVFPSFTILKLGSHKCQLNRRVIVTQCPRQSEQKRTLYSASLSTTILMVTCNCMHRPLEASLYQCKLTLNDI